MKFVYLAAAGFCMGGTLTAVGGFWGGMCIIGLMFGLVFALKKENSV
jgi:hypothetical protein